MLVAHERKRVIEGSGLTGTSEARGGETQLNTKEIVADEPVSRILFIALGKQRLAESKGLFDIREHRKCHRRQQLV
jgi:hypothetical protein